jgi:hypothetical protein
MVLLQSYLHTSGPMMGPDKKQYPSCCTCFVEIKTKICGQDHSISVYDKVIGLFVGGATILGALATNTS